MKHMISVVSLVAAVMVTVVGPLEAQTQVPPFKLPYTVGKENFATAEKNGAVLQDGVFRFTSQTPTRYTSIRFDVNAPYQPAIICSFEYRVTTNGADVNYVGVNFYHGKEGTFHAFTTQSEWNLAEIRFSTLQKKLNKGDMLSHMAIYAKCEEKAGQPTLEIRNLRFEEASDYDPLDGVRVSYSAYPVFDWPQEAGAEAYRLQYNGTSVEVKSYFYVPPEALKPGLVDYTVTALPSGKVVLRDSLIIPERHHSWRMPDYDFKGYAAKPHPRLKEMAEFLWPDMAFVHKTAKSYSAEPLPEAPQPYQEGAIPSVRSPIEWYGKIADGVIARQGTYMRILGGAAILTGASDYKQAAKTKLLGVLAWDPVHGGSNMKYGDLQAAWLLRGIIFCYDAAYDILTESEREAVRRNIRIRGDQFWNSIYPCKLNDAQNHSWDKTEAAAFAALALPNEPGMAERFRFAASLFAYRFFPSLGFEGENNEGLGYWSYGVGLAVRFVETAKYTVHLNLYQQPWLRQTARFPMYCMPPQGYPISFADNGMPNHNGLGPMHAKFTAKLASDSGDAAALWYAGYPEVKDMQAMFPIDLEPSRLYSHIGWAVFNTFLPDGRENVAVGFHAGKYFAGHQHADQNSFVINAYGDKLAIDGGYYDWWGSRHFTGYSTQTKAHNTILVDDKGQDVRVPGSDGAVTHYFEAPNFGYVAGDASKVYQRRVSRFDRELLFVKPDYVFVYDRLAAPKPAVFSWLMHSHTEQPIAADGGEFAIARPLAGLTGSILRPSAIKTSVAPAYTIMPVNGYSEDPAPNRQKEWCFRADNAAPVSQTEFLAAMRIQRGADATVEKRWTVEESASALLVRGSDVEVLFNRQPGQTVTIEKFTTDARCAAVILQDGTVVDYVKIGGKSLIYGTLHCQDAADCAGVKKTERRSVPAEIQFCGAKAALRGYEVRYPFGHTIYAEEGILTVPEAGTYEVIASTPMHAIVAQGEPSAFIDTSHARNLRNYGNLEPGKPMTCKLKQGKMILCLTAAQPLGQVVFRQVK